MKISSFPLLTPTSVRAPYFYMRSHKHGNVYILYTLEYFERYEEIRSKDRRREKEKEMEIRNDKKIRSQGEITDRLYNTKILSQHETWSISSYFVWCRLGEGPNVENILLYVCVFKKHDMRDLIAFTNLLINAVWLS